MEIKEITENDFRTLKGNRGKRDIPEQGTLNGNFDDLMLFLNWTLESSHNKNEEHLKDIIKVLTENYGTQISTKFLKNQMRSNFPNKTTHIRYLLNNAGMTTRPIGRYYKNKWRLEREIIDLIVANKEAYLERMAEATKRALKPRPKLEVEKEEPPKPDEPCIELNCLKCKKVMRIPTTPNMETNRFERMASGIYTAFISDVKAGIKLCHDCEMKKEAQGIWDTEGIINFLIANKGKAIGFTAEGFCKEFRNDKGSVCGVSVMYKLKQLELPIEVKVKGNEIKLLIA